MADISEVRDRQAQMWSEGDYRPIGRMLAPAAEALVEAAGVAAGQRVLDIGVGSGSVALAAARRGADVLGVDITDAWFAEARDRFAQQGVRVDLLLGDAEELAVTDHSFDVVLSSFAMVFAPQHQRVAAEAARACRPGGTVAYTAWEGTLATNALLRFLPPGPDLAGDVNDWADPAHVTGLFSGWAADWAFQRRSLPVAFASIAALESFVFENSGPMLSARDALRQMGVWGRANGALREAFAAENDATDGSYRAEWPYLLGVARIGDAEPGPPRSAPGVAAP